MLNACFINPAAFQSCAAGVQSLLVSAAVIAGGMWTVFTFTALGSAARAKRDLFEQAVLNITTTAEQVALPDSPFFGVAIRATLTNAGNRNVYLDFLKVPPFSVIPVNFDEAGVAVMSAQITGNLGRFVGMTLRRGATQQFCVVGAVSTRGLHYVEFQVAVSDAERLVHEMLEPRGERPEMGSLVWTDMTYIVVE